MKQKIFYLFFSLFCVILLMPLVSKAGTYTADGATVTFNGFVPCGKSMASEGESSGVTMPCQLCHLFVMGRAIIDFFLLTIIPPLAILMIAWGGMQILLAGGNPSTYKKGIDIIKWVVVGLVVIYGAWILVNTFMGFINLADNDLGRGIRNWSQINCGGFGMAAPAEDGGGHQAGDTCSRDADCGGAGWVCLNGSCSFSPQ